MTGRRPRRTLLLGLAGLAAITVACLLGPLLLDDLGPGDPLHAALLPPGATAARLVLADGRVLISPRVEIGPESVRLGGRGGWTSLDPSQVVERTQVRLWLGSDRYGRDLLRALLEGGRVSLAVAGLAGLVALLAGTAVGLLAATGGRWIGAILMRAVDAMLAFPVIFLLLLAASLLRPSTWLLVALLGLTSWMGLARLVRGQVLSLRSRGFILAARACGSPWHRTWRTHYLPHLVGPVGQDTALRLGDLVVAEATLSFLGLGVPPTVPTWGSLIAQGHQVLLDGWWLATLPGLAIATLVICLALVGDGLQLLAAGDAE